MAPDPPAYPIDERPPNLDAVLAMPNSDDSDNDVEEQQSYDGYTLLGQHELHGGQADNDDSENELDGESDVLSSTQQMQKESESLPTAGRAELAALWNSAPTEAPSNSIAMDDERSAQIKAAMAGFTLPPSAVPAWASDVPEELWKERLLGRLHQSSGTSKLAN